MTDIKFKELQAYKTEGGWKAVFMGSDKDGDLVFAHYLKDGFIVMRFHSENGEYGFDLDPYNVTTEEWKEPRKGEFWVNVYDNVDIDAYDTKEEADTHAIDQERIACVKVEWTEGEGL